MTPSNAFYFIHDEQRDFAPPSRRAPNCAFELDSAFAQDVFGKRSENGLLVYANRVAGDRVPKLALGDDLFSSLID